MTITASEALVQLQLLANVRLGDPLAPDRVRAFKLQEVIQSFEGKDLRPKEYATSEELIKKWNMLSAKGNLTGLVQREWRLLAWTPKVASSEFFEAQLGRGYFTINTSILKGLVYSYMSLFDDSSAAQRLRQIILQLLLSQKWRTGLIRKWVAAKDILFHHHAPRLLVRDYIIKDFKSPTAIFKEFGIFEPTSLSQAILLATVTYLLTEIRHPSSAHVHYLEQNFIKAPVLAGPALKSFASSLILSHWCDNLPIRDMTMAFVSTHQELGDPRLYPNRWLGMEKARDTFLGWMAREDIEFFFNLIIKSADDPHHRREFWLDFVKGVKRSKVFVGKGDYAENMKSLTDLKNKGRHFGELSDDTSAFVLDFGEVVVVEFNKVGNACYLYERRQFDKIFPDLWVSRSSVSRLKRKEYSIDTVNHTRGWEGKLRSILARCGIR